MKMKRERGGGSSISFSSALAARFVEVFGAIDDADAPARPAADAKMKHGDGGAHIIDAEFQRSAAAGLCAFVFHSRRSTNTGRPAPDVATFARMTGSSDCEIETLSPPATSGVAWGPGKRAQEPGEAPRQRRLADAFGAAKNPRLRQTVPALVGFEQSALPRRHCQKTPVVWRGCGAPSNASLSGGASSSCLRFTLSPRPPDVPHRVLARRRDRAAACDASPDIACATASSAFCVASMATQRSGSAAAMSHGTPSAQAFDEKPSFSPSNRSGAPSSPRRAAARSSPVCGGQVEYQRSGPASRRADDDASSRPRPSGARSRLPSAP